MIAHRLRHHRGTLRIAVTAVMVLGLAGAVAAREHHPVKRKTTSQTAPHAPRSVRLPNTQMEAVAFANLDGWAEDDHQAGFATFLQSCKAILKGTKGTRESRPIFDALYDVCQRAAAAKISDDAAARAFFEQNFKPIRIAPLGETNGFLTGYYEPVVDGTREANAEYSTPLYRRPAGMLPGGRMLHAASYGRKLGKGRRAKAKVVPFYDRAAIEDGVLNGKKLEICYLKDPIDAFFAHIQGSVRVKLDDGKMLRLNYDAQNGHHYTAVGKFLIERGIVSKEDMSMERIRQWMAANPEEGKELRRLNKSYVFFRETGLSANEEAIGAQGISLTAGRSIAVDRNIHVYGTPFFIQADLPIDSEQPTTKFRRLMVAQDTGGAIIGTARADIYWGASPDAEKIAGRLRHPGRFVMLFPNEVDPFAAPKDVPLPRARPAALVSLDKAALKAAQVPAQADAKKADAKKDDAKKVETKKTEAQKTEIKKSEAPPKTKK